MKPAHVLTRTAAVFSVVLGLGFGPPAAYGAWYFSRHGFVWYGSLGGYPTNGDGPFVDWGLPNSAGLMVAFVVVCAAEVAVGVMLWRGSPASLWLALGLLPFEVLFWVGFALPFAFPPGLSRTVLVLAALVDLHRGHDVQAARGRAKNPEPVLTRTAAVFSGMLALAFAVPAAYGDWYFSRHGFVWRGVLGYPTNGDGPPFVRWGVPNSTGLTVVFVAMCLAEVAVGVMLWRGSPASLWPALGLLPFEVLFRMWFALPYPLPVGLSRTVLVVAALLKQHRLRPELTAAPETSGSFSNARD